MKINKQKLFREMNINLSKIVDEAMENVSVDYTKSIQTFIRAGIVLGVMEATKFVKDYKDQP